LEPDVYLWEEEGRWRMKLEKPLSFYLDYETALLYRRNESKLFRKFYNEAKQLKMAVEEREKRLSLLLPRTIFRMTNMPSQRAY
jgi:DNA-directed RNA polymerase specialized sigma54-like protein